MRRVNSILLEPAESKGLSFLQAHVLKGAAGIEHAFMRRAGGFSPAPFTGLNFGGDDEPSNIRANMGLLVRSFGLPPGGVATAEQVHGRHVVVMDEAVYGAAERPRGDAIITAVPELPIGILTADCVPVLLHDPGSGAIAAVHAGWRGFVAGVLRETLLVFFRDFGARPANMLGAIGPYIGPCCYEVSEDLVESFRAAGLKAAPYFTRDKGGIHLDLGRAVHDALTESGLPAGNVSLPGPCTSCGASDFYSYRRDKVTGRQLSFIMKRRT
ncbi:MAG: peptidoglycan editing factor PgeF [Thermodesulfobacteriota bacterium]